jgi:predicted outer membrane repeat protein
VTITGSTFGASGTPNRALFTSGGAVYLNVSPATIGTSTFAYNTSKTNGAGVSSNYPLTLNTDVFLNNAVSNPNSSGGAVYSSGALTVAGSTFNNNTAITNGGAISAAALLTVSGSSFSMNQAGSTATSNGGAVYVSSNTANSISNTNFLANRVITTGSFAYGGALYANVANLTNVLFSGNSTSASTNSSFGGAAYYNSAANSQLTGVTFTGNSTTGGATNQDGGAVYIAGAGTLHIYNSTVSGNSAKLGGGLYNGGNGVISLYNSVVSGNSASNGYPDLDNGSNGGFAATFNDYANEGMTCSSSCTPMLSALGNYGGGTVGAPGYTTPVRVMLPLPGSPLLAAGTTTLLYAPTGLTSQVGTVICNGVATEPDARGCSYPRALTEAGSTQVDIGAAEANYSLSFVQQPTTTQPGSTVTPAPTVQLLESGVAGGDGVGNDQGSYAGGTLAITATPDAASTTTVTTTASGLESLSESFTPATASETLTVSALNGAATPVTVASATSNSFNVVGVPTVTGISPASGPTPGGGILTITGTNLIGVTSVSFGSVAATNVTVVSATSVTATIPAANATGTVDVTVINSARTSATSSVDQYTYVVSLGSFTVTGYSSPAVATEGGTVTVSAITGTGAIYTAFTGTVTLTSSDPKATLPATYTFLSSDNGVHTFSVTLNTLGTQSITATSGSVSGAQTGIVVGGSVWTVNATGTVSKLGPGGAALAGPVGTSGAVSTLGGVAFDASGGAWSVTQGNNALDYVNAAGGSSTAFTGGALNAPVAVAIDGSGTIWVANSGGSTVNSINNTGAPALSTQDASISVASGIAIDSSGNVWVTNSKTNTVDEVIGVAAPIAPLANAVQNNTTGVKP